MCSMKSCCYFFNIDFGCILIGITSFLFSGSMLVVEALLLWDRPVMHLELNLSQRSLNIIGGMAMLLSAVNMMAATLLMIGVIKRKAGFLLCYFGMGIFTTILSQLSALLVLLAAHWALGCTIFGVSLIYIHFLVVVHTMYDFLQRKETIEDSNNNFDQFEEPLIEA